MNRAETFCKEFNDQADGADDEANPKSKDNVDDDNTCSPLELDKFFMHKYKIHDEPAVTNDNSYVLSLAKDNSFTCVAAGISDGSVRLFDLTSEKGLYIEPPVKLKFTSICGVRFLDETPNLLLVGTTNGLVRLLDLRTRSEVSRFEYKFGRKKIVSFDCNSNGSLLCTGTVQKDDCAHIIFYDLRKYEQLYSYKDSHHDDVTSLCFHPQNPDLLCSGATDGLINIFDVTDNDEYGALLTTINTENTVHKVNWHTNNNGQDIISCITHTNTFASYKFDGDVVTKFDRLKIKETIKCKSYCNLIDCHSASNNDMMLLIGNNSNNGSILRSCKVNNEKLLPYADFVGNTQIVRVSIFDAKTNVFVTAGEGGFVSLWTPLEWGTSTTNNLDSSNSSSLKMKTNISNKFTP